MTNAMYFVASDNSASSYGVNVNDVWTRPYPGSPLLKLSQGQWTDYYTRDLQPTGGVPTSKTGSWFIAAFAEDNDCATKNAAQHPWMTPGGGAFTAGDRAMLDDIATKGELANALTSTVNVVNSQAAANRDAIIAQCHN